MRRGSKAKAPAKSTGFGRKGARGPSTRNILAMFTRYSNLGDSPGEAVDMGGICQLGEDLGIDPAADVRILVLCHRLGATERPGHISKQEWETGMAELGADSVQKLIELLPSFDLGFMEPPAFKEFYRFAFQFSREGTHRTLERDVAAPLLSMVMTNRSEHTKPFVDFLGTRAAGTRVTFDQWCSFLEFCLTVGTDLSEYDEDGAWPILLDEFVEHLRTTKGDGQGERSRP